MNEATFITRLLHRHGIYLSRRLGQHFLADEGILQKIARAVGADSNTDIVEIGAGIGNLTARLLESGARVKAIELDKRFRAIHENMAAAQGVIAQRLEFVYADALEFDFVAAAQQATAMGRKLVIAGNIPYQITSPLIMHILDAQVPFVRMVLLIQREVAERLASGPGTKRSGAISIKVQYHCRVAQLMEVPPNAFIPPPEVHSTLISLERVERGVTDEVRQSLFRLVEAGFGQRRKMLANSVAAGSIGFSKPQVEEALTALGLNPHARAEDLGLEKFMELNAQLMRTHNPEPEP